MARPIRIEFPGADYHVTARGNERRAIFRDDQDRLMFLETLEQCTLEHGLVVHGYCLMGNHYHLLVGTPHGNLSRAIGWLQTAYTIRFNRRHRRSGHLFQGRYKAQLIEADSYLLSVLRYLHLNPVRSRGKQQVLKRELRTRLETYRWSSHRAYAGLGESPPWLTRQWLLMFGKGQSAGRREYRRYMEEAFEKPVDNPWDALRGGIMLGSEPLWQKVRRFIGGKHGADELRWQDREQKLVHIREKAAGLIAKEPDSRVKVWLRVKVAGERRVDVARSLGYKDGSAVTQIIKRLEATAKTDPRLATRLERYRNLSCVTSCPLLA